MAGNGTMVITRVGRKAIARCPGRAGHVLRHLGPKGQRSQTPAPKGSAAALRDEAQLPPYLNPHCLRHTYTTTLIEMGWPMALVQEQMGHTHVATTAICTALSDDFKDRVLYASLGITWDHENDRLASTLATKRASP